MAESVYQRCCEDNKTRLTTSGQRLNKHILEDNRESNSNVKQLQYQNCVSENLSLLQNNTGPENQQQIFQLSKKSRRKKKRQAKAIAYNEKLEQRQMDAMLGSNIRQQLDIINPLRSDADKQKDLEKLSDMEDEDRRAWSKTLEANMHLLPDGYVPTLTEMPGAGYAGLTTFNDAKKEVQVRYDPDEFTYRDKDGRIGRMAATFTHELSVHGPNLDGEPDDEHNEMSSPEGRDDYLAATLRTFNNLDNDKQQRAFANEWKKDLFNQIAWDDSLTPAEKRIRRRWVNSEHTKMLNSI